MSKKATTTTNLVWNSAFVIYLNYNIQLFFSPILAFLNYSLYLPTGVLIYLLMISVLPLAHNFKCSICSTFHSCKPEFLPPVARLSVWFTPSNMTYLFFLRRTGDVRVSKAQSLCVIHTRLFNMRSQGSSILQVKVFPCEPAQYFRMWVALQTETQLT